ncbi:hypothetical protein [Saccharothrix lopnurensis]|uniref:Uncharacterized protein n=1 Tax=Saccharothrix lopnurensis TaxID=1670621 RepID=A0ABW1P419_9PSEU
MGRSSRPARPTSDPAAHPCPGGCGEQVPKRLLACRSCWWLLPAGLREEVMRLARTGPRVAHLGAVGDALLWYRANVRDGDLVDLVDGGPVDGQAGQVAR